MNTKRSCSSCGAALPVDAPAGLCVACLFKDALPANQSTEPDTGQPSTIVVSPSILANEKTGDRIGRYKLLQEIGEGGMGTVWMAEQEEPVRRRVALKVIKLGMDTKQVIGRFEAERQALALMDHPNIAKVLDAGATENGRPFFVMELVKGIPITKYCDTNKLGTKKRLELFMDVCRAVQHAHQKGIIHRDISPSNVLVANHDGKPVAMIIDFGIAKATDQKLTDKTVFTALGQFIGKPAYMSPEQAEMNALDVDTRTDIYSLGVLLYELLTGKTPFDAKDLVSAGLDGMRTMIRQQEPPRPSVRISSLRNDEQSTVAQQRESVPPKLMHLVRGDLDWVTMKCLEKDRSRRYETANGLAADIERHLNNEPVVACPPSNLYRFQKLVRRNKLAFGAAVAIALSLMAGIAVSTSQAIRATRAQELANDQRERAESEAHRADLNAGNEREQRERAEQAVRQANDALSMSLVAEGDQLVKDDAVGPALAYFARAVRLNPSNRVAAVRIVSLLNQRSFPLPLEKRPEGFSTNTNSVAYRNFFSRDFVSPGQEAKVIVDPISGRQITQGEFDGDLHRPPIFSLDGQKFAVLTSSNKVEVLSTRTGKAIMPGIYAPHTGSYQFVLFTPDGSHLLIGGGALAAVEVWKLASGSQTQSLQHESTAWAMAISADGRRLATGVRSGNARIWDLETGLQASEPCPGNIDVVEAELSPTGEFLATKHKPYFERTEGKMKFWDIRPGSTVPITLWHTSAVRRATFSPDCRLVVTVCDDGFARLWRREDGAMVFEQRFPDEKILKAVFSPNSELIALAGKDGELGVWDIRRSRFVWSKKSNAGESQLVFSPNGRLLVAGGGDLDPQVRIFDVQDGRLLANRTNSFGAVMSLDVANDNRRLAIAYRYHRAEIWDLGTMQRVGEPLTSNNGWIWHACFSKNGKWLATSSGGNAAQLWDAVHPVNKPLAVFRHGGGVTLSRFSEDDRLLLTCSDDRTARVWDLRSGNPISEPLRHGEGLWVQSSRVRSIFNEVPRDGMVFPDGNTAATFSSRGVTVWDIATGKALCDEFVGDNGITCSAFSQDGKYILSAAPDGGARIYAWQDCRDAPPEWLPILAEAVGGYRINDRDVAEFFDDGAQSIVELSKKLETADTAEPWTSWGNWYLADRSTRTINPDSNIRVQDYADQLSKQGTLVALEESLKLNPRNPFAYAKLAKLLDARQPEKAALYRKVSQELGGPTVEEVEPGATTKSLTSSPPPQTERELLDPTDAPALLKKLGEVVRIKGRPVKLHTSQSGTFHYLNFSENYRSGLTLAFPIINNPTEFRADLLQGYVNKTVIVEGTLGEYRGVPQIMMKSLSEMRVIESTGKAP